MQTSGNTKPLAIWMFIQAAGILAFYCFMIKVLYFPAKNYRVSFSYGSPLFNFIGITLVLGIFTFYCIWVGIKFIKKAKQFRLQKEQFEKEFNKKRRKKK